jgi:hypothetical protein
MRRHLAPGGRLALHLFDPRLDLLVGGVATLPRLPGPDPVTHRRCTGEVLQTRLDHGSQVRRDLWQYTEFDPAGEVVEQATREMALRWTYRWELQHLLTLSGFRSGRRVQRLCRLAARVGQELIVTARIGG